VVDFSAVVLLVSLSFFSTGFSVEDLSELDDEEDEDEDLPAPDGERWSVE